MAPSAPNSLLIVVSAPSGGGKTTVCEEIIRSNPNAVRAITCTTRAPRDGETDGVDYYFLDAARFLERVQAGHFLEHAVVYGNRYGTLKSEVLGHLRDGKDVMLSVDVQGVASIVQCAGLDCELKRALVTVFLTPPSLAILEERLRKRGKDAPEVMEQRLKAAREEVSRWRDFDYLIESRSIPEDVQRMQAIITAERMRPLRMRFDGFK